MHKPITYQAIKAADCADPLKTIVPRDAIISRNQHHRIEEMAIRSNLKLEAEFINYLATEYRGRFSGKPLNTKVISDTLGRIRRLQSVFNIKIENYTKNNESFTKLCQIIKSRDNSLREIPTKNKYGYGRYVYAARLYFKFDTWKHNREIDMKIDKRFTC